MPWQLTTPYSGGDLDTVHAYTQVKIVGQQWSDRRKQLFIELEYGATINGAWEAGMTPLGKSTGVVVEGADYTDLVTNSLAQAGERTYDAMARGLYTYLAGKGLLDAGAIV